MTERKIILFGNKTTGIYRLSEIFDPYVDGTDPVAAGKIVPALYSQVIDDVNYRKNKLFTVIALDETTFKATLIPTEVIDYGDQERVVSYGNDIYMLYYDTVNHKLIVDDKLTFFGEQGVKYQIIRINTDGTTTVISKYATTPLTTVVSTIPLSIDPINNSKKCGVCYTDLSLDEGDHLRLIILDTNDIAVANVMLVAKEAFGVTEPNPNPIVGLTVSANQMLESGNIALYRGQNKNSLVFTISTKLADDTTIPEVIDNITSHAYGIEEVESTVVGAKYNLLFKKYLTSPDYAVNYVYCTKELEIIAAPAYGIAKISVIPVWSTSTKTWTLSYLAYKQTRDDTTAYIAVTSTPTFNGTKFDTTQTIVLKANHDNPFGVTELFEQKYTIRLNSPRSIVFNSLTYTYVSGTGNSRIWRNITSNVTRTISYNTSLSRWEQRNGSLVEYYSTASGNPWNNGVSWKNSSGTGVAYICDVNTAILQDTTYSNWTIGPDPAVGSLTYGDITKSNIRPKIYYSRKTGTSGYVYNIPASKFGTGNVGLTNFLNNFYYNAYPPTILDEVVAPKPTHFTIRARTTLAALLGAPIAIEDWNSNLTLNEGSSGSHSGTTVIVEFLLEHDGVYDSLYGVPVEVITTTAYS